MTIMPFTTKIFVFTLIGKVRSISLKVEVKEEIAGSKILWMSFCFIRLYAGMGIINF